MMKEWESMRLQKYLARSGMGSRRACEANISEGRTTINGDEVTEPGTKVFPGDIVEVDGIKIEPKRSRYFILNKPPGSISVNLDSRGRKWVVDFIPGGREMGLFPVGRLDVDTTGLIIITNDGDLGNRIAHPRYEVIKKYHALIKGQWSHEKLRDSLEKGIRLENGESVRGIRVLSASSKDDRTETTISIHEGRKHVVRRIFLALGSRVYELKRLAIGGLEIGDLPPGEYTELDHESMVRLIFGEMGGIS
jgi:23S rRNA pseudouridine2605 synthase